MQQLFYQPCAILGSIGVKIAGIVYGSALNAGDISRNTDFLKAAKALGKKLGK